MSLLMVLPIATRGIGASTINIPPVTITQLAHFYNIQISNIVYDGISIPGSGYTSSGFTATILQGDVVTIRFQAPPGKKFVVHVPRSLYGEQFYVDTYWISIGDGATYTYPHTVVFENFHGVAPTETYTYVGVSERGRAVLFEKTYDVNGEWEFTAMQVTMQVSRPIPPELNTFSGVQSHTSGVDWGILAFTSGENGTLMEIVDSGIVSTARTSWGRLKALYR